jgi:hypothetical protein
MVRQVELHDRQVLADGHTVAAGPQRKLPRSGPVRCGELLSLQSGTGMM